MKTLKPYPGKPFDLDVHVCWEVGCVMLTLKKEGRQIANVDIPQHLVVDCVSAMLHENEALHRADRNYINYIKENEPKVIQIPTTDPGDLSLEECATLEALLTRFDNSLEAAKGLGFSGDARDQSFGDMLTFLDEYKRGITPAPTKGDS